MSKVLFFVVRLRLILLVITWMGAHPYAYSLESWEHKQLSDLAYHLALKIHCDEANSHETRAVCALRDSEKDTEALKLFYDPLGKLAAVLQKNDAYYVKLSYGTIVACVDYFMTTEKMMAGRENKLITSLSRYKRGSQILDGYHESPELYPERRSQFDLDDVPRCNDSIWNLEGMRAGHVNHAHFQAELLIAQRNNHLTAIAISLLDKNIFSSLLANAASDHYLQDAFAPGHIISWRNRLTDTAANAQHDEINRSDVFIRFDPAVIAGGNAHSDLIARVYAELRDERLRSYFFVPQNETRLKYTHTCRHDCRTEAASKDLDDLHELVTALSARQVQPIKVKGDGDLWQRGSDKQRFVMLLTQIRSILDVLESGESNTFKDSFRNASWDWHEVDRTVPVSTAAVADAEKGKDGEPARGWLPSRLTATIGPVKYDLPMDQRSEVRKVRAVDQAGTYVDYSSRDAIFGLSLGGESAVLGDERSRFVTTLDFTLGTKSHQSYSINSSTTLLLSGFTGRQDWGYGAGARYAFILPATEVALSFPVSVQHIRPKGSDDTSFNRPSFGIRLDAGFTSFLTFYLELRRTSAMQHDGSIRSGPAMGAGIQLAAPKCRILKICK